jgi:hypothetical protein
MKILSVRFFERMNNLNPSVFLEEISQKNQKRFRKSKQYSYLGATANKTDSHFFQMELTNYLKKQITLPECFFFGHLEHEESKCCVKKKASEEAKNVQKQKLSHRKIMWLTLRNF